MWKRGIREMPQKMYLRVAMAVRIAIWAAIVMVILFGRQLVESGLLGCFWNRHFGIVCATCGGSRAVISLLSGDFSGAAQLNPVVTYALLPIFAFLVVSDIVVLIWSLICGKRRLTPLEYCFSVFGAEFRPKTKRR